MRKRLTLKRAWKLCLEMWRWIAEQIRIGDLRNVATLKHIWVEANCRDEYFLSNCLFCEYDLRNRKPKDGCCSMCPGRLVIKNFSCGDGRYNYAIEPIEFYKKLVWIKNRKDNEKLV